MPSSIGSRPSSPIGSDHTATASDAPAGSPDTEQITEAATPATPVALQALRSIQRIPFAQDFTVAPTRFIHVDVAHQRQADLTPVDPAHRRDAVFGSTSPLDFAETKLDRDPEKFFEQLSRYPFTDQEKLQLADIDPYHSKQYAENFRLTTRKDRIELAIRLLHGNGHFEIGRIGLTTQADRLEVARGVKSYTLIAFATEVRFDKEEHRMELACKAAETVPGNLIPDDLKKFDLSPDHQREVIFIAANSVDPHHTVDFSESALSDPQDQRKVMFFLAAQSPGSCIESHAYFDSLDAADRFEIATIIADKDPDMVVEHIDRFGIAEGEKRVALYGKICESGMNKILEDALQADQGEIDRLCVARQAAQACHETMKDLFGDDTSYPGFSRNAEQLGIRYPWIARMLDAARQEPDERVRDALGTYAQYANVLFCDLDMPQPDHDIACATLQAIYRYRKPETRFSLTDMLVEALDSETPPSADRFRKISQGLARPHALIFRPLLSALAGQDCLTSDMETRLSTALSHSALKDAQVRDCVVNGMLALIEAEHIDAAQRERLLTALSPIRGKKDDVKDFARNMQALADFIPLTGQPGLAEMAASKMAALKQGNGLRVALGEMLFHVLGRQNIENSVALGPQQFVDRLQQYNNLFRKPSPIAGYASKLSCELPPGEEKDAIFSVINRFIDVTVLADDPTEFAEFVRAKNDVSKSEHLQRARSIDSKAVDLWLNTEKEVKGVFSNRKSSPEDVDVGAYLQQRIVRDAHVAAGTYPVVERVLKGEMSLSQAVDLAPSKLRKNEAELLGLLDTATPATDKARILSTLIPALEVEDPNEREAFENNLHDLKALLSSRPRTKQDLSQWAVKFKHVPEDYLRCGMVSGSCQHPHELAKYNKALMGYVMQGKNRMVAVTSPDGTLQARCIVRLGIDPRAERLLMHLEPSYFNAGVPTEYDRVLLDLAKEVARDIGVPLVTHADEFETVAPYPNSIRFYPDAAACEYVDSEGLGVVDSRSEYSLELARVIDTAA